MLGRALDLCTNGMGRGGRQLKLNYLVNGFT